ncbi:MAG TPA: glycerophosphodiester phosphodiesterase, partial [Idiomarina loihiensis]|nr:glycerophosphodiester phosphodiesterase [Idiomarina loihiensis]
MKKIIITLSLLILLIVIAGISNAYLFVPSLKREGEVVAYRAGGGSVNYSKLNETGCTAKSLLESEVGTVENTLEAASTSVQAGTDVLHLNVHRTLDDQLVVFHDWTL